MTNATALEAPTSADADALDIAPQAESRRRPRWLSAIAVALLALVAACGGGGDDDDGNGIGTGDAGTPVAEAPVEEVPTSPGPPSEEPVEEVPTSPEPPAEAPVEEVPAPPAPPASAPTVPARLSMMAIETANRAPIVSREVYLPGTFRLADADNHSLAEGTLDIRGRGNTTWSYPKKPYRVRLAKGEPLLDMPTSRHWVLLANHRDPTLLRNDVVFEMSRMLGMAYTPRSGFVDVTLNGTYDGVYQLTENIRIAPDRVNIPALGETDTGPDVITGGYLLEVDERLGEDFCFRSKRTPMAFCASDPEDLGDTVRKPQRDYIVNYIDQTDNAIFGPSFADPSLGYAAYIDVDSAITYYLIQEMIRNVDGNLRLSTYLYKKRGGKLFFGPLWDFDRALGAVGTGSGELTEGWYIRLAPWFTRMFEDPGFEAKVKDRWAQMKADGIFEAVMAYIDDRAIYLSEAQKRNNQRWNTLGGSQGAYEREVLKMKTWLQARIDWMDAQLRQ